MLRFQDSGLNEVSVFQNTESLREKSEILWIIGLSRVASRKSLDQEDVEPHVSGVRLLDDGYVSEIFLMEKIDSV